jgi:hypothetical protein
VEQKTGGFEMTKATIYERLSNAVEELRKHTPGVKGCGFDIEFDKLIRDLQFDVAKEARGKKPASQVAAVKRFFKHSFIKNRPILQKAVIRDGRQVMINGAVLISLVDHIDGIPQHEPGSESDLSFPAVDRIMSLPDSVTTSKHFTVADILEASALKQDRFEVEDGVSCLTNDIMNAVQILAMKNDEAVDVYFSKPVNELTRSLSFKIVAETGFAIVVALKDQKEVSQ